MSEENSVMDTVLRSVATAVSFFVLIYLVAPIIELVLGGFGMFLVPDRLDGGEDPGIFALLWRAAVTSGLATIGAYYVGERLFSNANTKVVGGVFGAAVICWAAYLIAVMPAGTLSESIFAGYLPIAIFAAPPLVVSYWYISDD